ncbi:GNAT family N-acetyltransferase [Roseobacter sp. YSTF-M11]|uniref:GNAT family N-acetyltransferase n=1 Tax=Roseobacter insulae TaxID=2859783 RepID=A0A9X1FTT6_9RHOB|nr:GNAT family N-acetyltransferase [Roseobacter insulae]MBW4707679.1 GNAT family N-acetyltransferase [Roseobacter insulae]
MTKPAIKPTTKDDIPALRRVLDQTELFPGDLLPEMLSPSLHGATDAFWLTCHLDGTAAGLCYTVPEDLTDGTWNMRALAVRPDLQGKGLGTALVGAAEEYLRRTGQRILVVDTSGTDDFASTRKFYARNGYAEEARIRDFWSAGDDKVIFRKALR